MVVTLLHACGLQLRGGDPVAMKEFVVAVHARAAEEAAGGTGRLTKRAAVLLELVVDVKNNRWGAGVWGGGEGRGSVW